MASVLLIGLWMSCTFFITTSGLIYFFLPKLPQLFLDTLLYGKAKNKKRRWTPLQLLEVPKRWFSHFYIVGVLVNGYMLYTAFNVYILGNTPPTYVGLIYDYLVDANDVNTGAMSAIIVLSLMFVQNCRRLAECFLISVYSKSTMNIAHYAMGILLYSTFSFAVLAEAPSIYAYRVSNVLQELQEVRHLAGILLFLWASYNHHLVHKQFAQLRRDKSGNVKSLEHKIPRGGWFSQVSCPHYFFEILIYLAFIIITGTDHKTLWVIVIFVLDNQIIAGYITHFWYLTTFKDYPKNRKAVIPYIL